MRGWRREGAAGGVGGGGVGGGVARRPQIVGGPVQGTRSSIRIVQRAVLRDRGTGAVAGLRNRFIQAGGHARIRASVPDQSENQSRLDGRRGRTRPADCLDGVDLTRARSRRSAPFRHVCASDAPCAAVPDLERIGRWWITHEGSHGRPVAHVRIRLPSPNNTASSPRSSRCSRNWTMASPR